MTKLRYIGLMAIFALTMTAELYAQDNQTVIKKLLKLPSAKEQAGCMRSVLQKDVTTQKELFATEQCPLIQSAAIEIVPEVDKPGASKGKLHIKVDCNMTYTDYYVGKKKRSYDHSVKSTIEADYIYALEELSLKNVMVKGDRFCAHPIMLRLKKFK